MPIKLTAAPASADDRFTLTETAATGTLTFNVRANDGKNSSKLLYALDDGQSADLATADPVGPTNDRSALGATIWINANGIISYNTAAIAAQIDALAPGETLQDSFLYALQIGGNSGVWSTVRLTFTGTNDAPVAAADVAAVAEGSVINGNVGSNDRDVDRGSVLAFAPAGSGLPAGFSMAANGAWTFDANHPAYQMLAAGEVRTLTVNYSVTDQYGASSAASLTITLTGTNDAPVATAASASLVEDGQASGRLTAVDPDHGAVLGYSLIGDAPAGFSLAADGQWQFDASGPAWQHLREGEVRTVVVAVKVSDGQGGSANSTLTLSLTGRNDAAIVTGATLLSLGEDDVYGSASIIVTDPDAGESGLADYSAIEGSYGYALFGPAVSGAPAEARWSYEVKDDAIVQSLAEGETVTDSFTIAAPDGTPLTFTVVMTGANDAPVASNATATVDEDGLVAGQLIASDIDRGALLTFAAQGSAPVGFSLAADGSWTFDANQAAYQSLGLGETTTVTIAYVVTDEHGLTSNAALTLTVTGTNDRPVTTFPAAEAVEGQLSAGQLVALDADDGAALVFALDSGGPAGFVLLADGSWTFDANVAAYDHLAPGETLMLEVPFTVTDEHGAATSARLIIAVSGSNDGPRHSGTPLVLAGTLEDQAFTFDLADLLNGWSDPESDPLTAGSLSVDHGTISVDGGRVTYTPDAEFSGPVTISYQVADLGGAATSGSASFSVAAVNDPSGPFSGTMTGAVREDRVLTASGNVDVTDPDGPSDSWSTIATPVASALGYGSYTVSASGVWAFTLKNDHPAVAALATGESLTDTLLLTTIDGTTTEVSITIAGRTDIAYVSPISSSDPQPYQDYDNDRDFFTYQWAPRTYSGGPYDDTIDGSTGNDILTGRDGYDRIYGHGGDDLIYGDIASGSVSAGNDTVYGQAGNDTIYGGSGEDRIYGGSGDDILYGNGTGASEVQFSSERIHGGSGNDQLIGGAHQDILTGGHGVDILTGGGAGDHFYFHSAAETGDTITDFQQGMYGDRMMINNLGVNRANFVGLLTGPGQVENREVGYFVENGVTTVYIDTDGVAGADLEIHLLGVYTLTVNDFGWF